MKTNKLFPFMQESTLSSLSEADNVTKNGIYNVTGTNSASALTDWGTLIAYNAGRVQEFHPANRSSMVVIRTKLESGWKPWYKIEGTELT